MSWAPPVFIHKRMKMVDLVVHHPATKLTQEHQRRSPGVSATASTFNFFSVVPLGMSHRNSRIVIDIDFPCVICVLCQQENISGDGRLAMTSSLRSSVHRDASMLTASVTRPPKQWSIAQSSFSTTCDARITSSMLEGTERSSNGFLRQQETQQNSAKIARFGAEICVDLTGPRENRSPRKLLVWSRKQLRPPEKCTGVLKPFQ